MNRDSREIFGWFSQFNGEEHYRILLRALNASVILAEDRCIMPPGFVLEDEIAFNLMERQSAFLAARAIEFPMREDSLSDYAEKKRIEYFPMRDRYSGLFSDRRIEFLAQTAEGLIKRKSHISEKIEKGWENGPDARRTLWRPVKKLVLPQDIEEIRRIPESLSNRGTALTWAAISPELPQASRAASRTLRNILQFTYFNEYCKEFDLLALSAIPHTVLEFHLPQKPTVYSYSRLQRFLTVFGLSRLFLDAPANFLVSMKWKPGFTSFIDSYAALAAISSTPTDLNFAASLAMRAIPFDFAAYAKRFNVLVGMPGDLEIAELDDALLEAAAALSTANGLPRRGEGSSLRGANAHAISTKETYVAELVLFVALEEELEILSKDLNLSRNFGSPAATGKVGGVEIEVLCPKTMGRVPAAVEVTAYLEARKYNLPRLLLIVGLAGGFPEEGSEPGHVICAHTVVDLAVRKIVDANEEGSKAKFRRRDFNQNMALRDLLSSGQFDAEAWIKDSIEVGDWPKDRRPSIHVGPLASVDEVVSSNVWRAKILEHTEKLLGVEMEAGGVCAAADRYGVQTSMVRVVSDNADPAKADDGWRKRGMRTLAQLLAKTPLDILVKSLR